MYTCLFNICISVCIYIYICIHSYTHTRTCIVVFASWSACCCTHRHTLTHIHRHRHTDTQTHTHTQARTDIQTQGSLYSQEYRLRRVRTVHTVRMCAAESVAMPERVEIAGPGHASATSSPKNKKNKKNDLNTATEADLRQLFGFGPILAKRIAATRWQRWGEVSKIAQIGFGRLEKLQEHFAIAEEA